MAEIVSELKILRSTVSRLIGSMCEDGISHRILVNKVGRPVVSKSQYLATVRDAILATPKPDMRVYTSAKELDMPVKSYQSFVDACHVLNVVPRVASQHTDRAVTPQLLLARKNFASQVVENNSFYKLVFLDEAGFDDNDLPAKVLAIKGSKNVAQHTFKSGAKRVTLIMAITCAGIISVGFFTGGVNQYCFGEFLEKQIKPFWQSSEGRIMLSSAERNTDQEVDCRLTMDNVGFHKTSMAQGLMRGNRTSWKYLPPYTPAFNPIELVFNVI
jgi:hypothetical protein